MTVFGRTRDEEEAFTYDKTFFKFGWSHEVSRSARSTAFLLHISSVRWLPTQIRVVFKQHL